MSNSNDQNLTIRGTGKGDLAAGKSCCWESYNGVDSVLAITNLSGDDELTVSISGAPSDIKGLADGLPTASINGVFKIPANSPELGVEGVGDFKGAIVHIQNVSSLNVTALVVVTKKT